MSKIRVIAAVVDTTQLRLYKEDGRTVDIPQGDPRLVRILNEISPILEAKLVATVELEEPNVVRDTSFADYEKKAGGFTRFFRVAKAKLVNFFTEHEKQYEANNAPVAPQSLGVIPVEEPKPTASPKITAAIADIMAHAEPASHETFNHEDTTKDETIIAVVDDGKGNAAVVPGVENLKGHIKHAAKLGNTKGMEAFLQRLGAAISKRGHTVDDVLRFMERGDLPLADDGCIIAYKVLKTKSTDNPNLFVDCHTGKVEQKVGSFVKQDESLIDKSRSQECSTGLHIARRGYLGGFPGDIITMVKIKPEDVIAVPHGEPNKVRVAGYHIIAKIPKDEHQKLRTNTAMAGTNALKLLTQAIAGDHIDVTEVVNITAARGGSFTVTPVGQAKGIIPSIKKETALTPALPDPVKKEARKLDAPKVDPKKVAEQVTKVRIEQKDKPLTKADQARVLFTAGKFDELKAFKKDAKKSWSALGFTGDEELAINGSNASTVTSPPATETGESNTKKKEQPVAEPVKLTGTRAEVARTLFEQAVAGDKSRWGTLWQHQKSAKKSWAILGFTPKEIERIKTNKPDWV